MTLPTTGPISMDDLRTEFEAPGSRSIQDFYRGGAIVPASRGASVNSVAGEFPTLSTSYSGTRSNVVTAGQTERITIGFNDDFNAGTAGDTAAYDFDIDTSDTHISGNVTGSFPDTVTTGQLAAQHLHDEIEATYTGVTVGDPVATPGVGGSVAINFTNATINGFISQILNGEWHQHDSLPFVNVLNGATSSEIATAFFNVMSGLTLRSDISVTQTGDTITVSSTTNGFNFGIATFVTDLFLWDADWVDVPTITVDSVLYPTVDTTSSAAATPWAPVGTIAQHSITIDTGIQANVSDASITITENSGSITQPIVFQVFNGAVPSPSNVHSTYAVTDYNDSEITMFTSSVASTSDTDVQSVINTLVTAVTNNVETPINFDAVNNSSITQILLTGTTQERFAFLEETMIVSLRFTPPATGTIGLNITGLTVTGLNGAVRNYASPTLSYTSLSDLVAVLTQEINTDNQLLVEGVVDGSDILLVVRSANELWEGDISIAGQTVSLTAVDYTQGGNLTTASGTTISGKSGEAQRSSLGVWNFTVDHGAGDGNIEITAGAGIGLMGARPITGFMLGDPINEDVPESGVVSLQDFYGATRY